MGDAGGTIPFPCEVFGSQGNPGPMEGGREAKGPWEGPLRNPRARRVFVIVVIVFVLFVMVLNYVPWRSTVFKGFRS